MKDLETTLNSINKIIEEYESGVWKSADSLRDVLRKLTINNYHLTKYNIELYQMHNDILFNHDGSVSSGQIKADKMVPELRQCRKIMDAVNQVIWSMRSEISIIKNEN